MNTVNEIIDPSIYSKQSLEDSISQLSEKEILISDEKIINLIIKYFFAYRYPESTNIQVPLGEIEELFSISHFFFYLSRQKAGNQIDINDDEEILNTLNYLQNNGYPISMLGDIATTTSIFKSIIDSIINPEEFEGKYFGLDLGTGTGILLLAQYIQAKRNNFSEIKNLGIEILDLSARISNELVSNLGVGKVIQGDTTLVETYESLGIKQSITHISNENIPTNGIQMTGKNDPFFQNFQALFSSYGKKINNKTSFFPSTIDIGIDLGGNSRKIFSGNQENNFSINLLLEMEKYLIENHSEGIPSGWKIFDNIFPEGILIGDKIVKLNEIGQELESKGLVKHLNNWRHRWK